MASYNTDIDIANRALQHCRMKRIQTFTDQSPNAYETAMIYDKVREAELRANCWRFATKRAILRGVTSATQLWTPPAYASGTTYALGAVVVDSNGVWWQAQIGGLLGVAPAVGASWERYYGPDSLQAFVAAASAAGSPPSPALGSTAGGSLGFTTYYAQLTYVTPSGETLASGESSLAVATGNLLTVASPPAGSGATGYNVYAATTSGSEMLQNASPIAIGTPWTEPTTGLVRGVGPPISTSSTQYYAGELVVLNGTIYLALATNQDTPPSPNWLAVGGTLTILDVVYPIGVGPANDFLTLNYFRLPHGFLRQAPSNPKDGINPYLGAPRGPVATDWLFESNFIVSADAGPIMLRYVANVVDVPSMDPMFCEMLAARIAEEAAPILVAGDSAGKEAMGLLTAILNVTRQHYRDERFKAIGVNGIETGTVEPPEDDFITCRY